MSDIVERLRGVSPQSPGNETEYWDAMSVAADTIARLRAALSRMLSVCDKGAHDSYEIYRACDFARAALESKENGE